MTTGDRTSWAPVWAMALGVASLTTSELLPISLLTPMARDLQVSTGTAGQAITVTAGVAVVTAVLVAWATRRVNRRTILLVLTALHAVASLGVALAPAFPLVIMARAFVGLSLGTFWAMSAALALRLVNGPDVPKALGLIFGGSSIAGVTTNSIASFLGGVIGWRAVFLAAAALGVVAFIAQTLTLPSMPSTSTARLATVVEVIRRPVVVVGLLGVFLTFGGSRLFYLYIRPLIDRTVHGDVALVSLLLLVFGTSCFIGTTQAARLHRRNLRATIAAASLSIAVLCGVLVFVSGFIVPTTAVLVLWGLAYGVIPVGWSTWVTRAIADQAETGGGIQVAVIQAAILSGAAVGGVIIDRFTVTGVLVAAGAMMLIAAVQVLTQLSPTGSVRITVP